MYKNFCGIDFGTTNSAISVNQKNKSPHLIKFNNKELIPTAIFFPEEDSFKPLYGSKALSEYINGSIGRFMRSLKRILGTDLMNLKTDVNGISMSYEDIILKFIKYLKNTAEEQIDTELISVVLGRPVHFQDFSPDSDDKAEKMLRKIALNAGFKNISFQYEPISAAYYHEQPLQSEKLACVIDIGGGTSDFSIIKLGPNIKNKINRKDDILANTGVRIGGNDFDRDLSIKCFMPSFGYGTYLKPDAYTKQILPIPFSPYVTLSEWSSINSLYTYSEQKNIKHIYENSAEPQKVANLYEVVRKELGHTLLNHIENCKIELSSKNNVETSLDFLSRSPLVVSSNNDFILSIKKDVNAIVESLSECLKQAQVYAHNIEMIILTGGSTEIPYIRNSISNMFPNALISDENKLSSVAIGLSYDAARIYE